MSPSPSRFTQQLTERQTDPAGRRWLFVPYDQLSDRLGPLSREDPSELGIVVVESPAKAARRPYHVQKLALVLSNLRHFALEQAERGVAVRHVVSPSGYRDALATFAKEIRAPLRCMTPAERELRQELSPLAAEGRLEWIPHEGWLTTAETFAASHPKGPPWRMDRFYRHVRKETGILMEDGKPSGGKLSFDADNRARWRGEPPPPPPLRFEVDDITEEVCELVRVHFDRHPGRLDPTTIPASAADAAAVWTWAKTHCMELFGPYQDAMSRTSASLFHTRVSALLHLHRLLPRDVVTDVADGNAPIASREGFVRQVLGWREFVRHVHEATDGFRDVSANPGKHVTEATGDGGYERWSGEPWAPTAEVVEGEGGAAPNHLGAERPLPPAFWGSPSGLACLDHVVDEVWRDGYGHHITRLMVLSNLATLLDISPRELTDWFWVAFTDAYDWVVEPNVLGMGTFAVGDLMTTKPYVAGSAYIDRMSDYCGPCAFHPKKNCPIRSLYWAFLERHRGVLTGNRRLAIPLASAAKRSDAQKAAAARTFKLVSERLSAGKTMGPRDFEDL